MLILVFGHPSLRIKSLRSLITHIRFGSNLIVEAAAAAFKIRRSLVVTRSYTFQPNLAISLYNPGNRQSELGQREAVQLFLTFARVLPARFMQPLLISARGPIRDLENASMPLEKESLLGDVIALLESQQGADSSTSS